MFWREDKYVHIDNENRRQDPEPRKDRFVMRKARRRIPSDTERAKKMLAKHGVYKLVRNGLAVPIDQEVEKPVEQPSGLPDLFSRKAKAKLPILWEVEDAEST